MKNLQIHLKTYFSHPFSWIIGGVFCCLLSLFFFFSKQQKLKVLEKSAFYLKNCQQTVAQKKTQEKKLLKQLKIADRDYLEKEIEKLEFLTSEIKKLQAFIHSDPENKLYLKRLQFLQNQNRIRFREQSFHHFNQFQQIEAIQEEPVEMNQDDLKSLLAKVENQTIGYFNPGKNPPDLFIKKFKLTKKALDPNEEVFVVQLELIKREMAP